jgi:cell division protein ZapB
MQFQTSAVPDRRVARPLPAPVGNASCRRLTPVDRCRAPLYSGLKHTAKGKQALYGYRYFAMSDQNNEKMDLSALENRVDELIRTVELLKTENSALRSQQDSLVAERAALIEKTEQARARIESMISRLRAMETR